MSHKAEAFTEIKSVRAWTRDPRCIVSLSTVWNRLRNGWTLERALITSKHNVGRPPLKIVKQCSVCGSDFVAPHSKRRNHTCSRKCNSRRQTVANGKRIPRIPPGVKLVHTSFRNASNQVFEVHNLIDFIRSNPRLFLPEDVIWKTYGAKHRSGLSIRRKLWCRASVGLHAVHAGRLGSWKGWTLAATSHVSPPGTDLLQRVVVV